MLVGGHTTDVRMIEGEESESESETVNQAFAFAPGTLEFSQVIETFQNALEDCIRPEAWMDCRDFQKMFK